MSRLSKDEESGAAMAEFAVVLPLLLMLFLTAFEFQRILEEKQIGSQIGREVGAIAFRECAYANDPQQCLDETVQKHSPLLNTLVPGAQITVSLYQVSGSVLAYNVKQYAVWKQAYMSGVFVSSPLPRSEDPSMGFQTVVVGPGPGPQAELLAKTASGSTYPSKFQQKGLTQFQKKVSSLNSHKPVTAIVEIWTPAASAKSIVSLPLPGQYEVVVF